LYDWLRLADDQQDMERQNFRKNRQAMPRFWCQATGRREDEWNTLSVIEKDQVHAAALIQFDGCGKHRPPPGWFAGDDELTSQSIWKCLTDEQQMEEMSLRMPKEWCLMTGLSGNDWSTFSHQEQEEEIQAAGIISMGVGVGEHPLIW
jgi:hypothetical protein